MGRCFPARQAEVAPVARGSRRALRARPRGLKGTQERSPPPSSRAERTAPLGWGGDPPAREPLSVRRARSWPACVECGEFCIQVD